MGFYWIYANPKSETYDNFTLNSMCCKIIEAKEAGVGQRTEHLPSKEVVEGSIPFTRARS